MSLFDPSSEESEEEDAEASKKDKEKRPAKKSGQVITQKNSKVLGNRKCIEFPVVVLWGEFALYQRND